jgi:phenylacetate-CoA ligase
VSLEDRLYPLLPLYDRFPIGAKKFLGTAYRLLPQGIRRGKHYSYFQKLIEEGESWTREEIWDYQLKQLRRTLHNANAFCPFYTRTFAEAHFRPEFVSAPDDLLLCPTISKRDIIDHREEMAATNLPDSQRLYITTGGSTGVPVGFYLQKGISRPKEQAMLEGVWKRTGYFDGARLALLRGHVTTSRSDGKISSYDATRDWLVLSSSHLTSERLPEYLEQLERFRPDLLYVYPSAILQLAQYLEVSGQSWRTPLRGILCGSERLTISQKQTIERVFKCRAYAWYGHSERVVLAAQGTKSDLSYFVPQYGYVEFGPPTPEGLREVIGTSFDNMVMPLIRYRTGDYVRLAEDSKSFEYPVPAAVEICGREQEFLVSATGRKISLTAVNMHDAVFDGLYAVQFFQAKPGYAEFRYIPAPGFSNERLPKIADSLQKKLGDDFIIEMKAVAEVEKTSAGKHKWLVSAIGS